MGLLSAYPAPASCKRRVRFVTRMSWGVHRDRDTTHTTSPTFSMELIYQAVKRQEWSKEAPQAPTGSK